ncbi:MAG: ABC transporter ATP-binding protein [Tissierellia bacterium]|nr:ABC transporter ATP-binding protein [Tissierellia bacterium]
MSDNSIYIKNGSVVFETENESVEALKSTNLKLKSNRVTAIMGESGCGKSVLLLLLLSLLPNYAKSKGEIFFGKQNITLMNKKDRLDLLGSYIGYIPQDPYTALNPVRKIKYQLAESIKEKEGRNEKIINLLNQFGFDNPKRVLNSYPFELSGGMIQRVLCAIGIANNPKWIFADEPTKGLDDDRVNMTIELIRNLRLETDASILIITHDPKVAMELADDVVIMYGGKVIEQNENLFENPIHPYTKAFLNSSPERGFHPIQDVDSLFKGDNHD